MKYNLILLLSLLALALNAQEASDIRVTYSNQDASLEQIFADLESQYGIRFSYATSSLENKMTDADFEDVSIQNVLSYLLADEDLEYKIVSNNVLVRKTDSYKEKKDKYYKSSIHLQGKIVNDHGDDEVLDYATISISNSSVGTYSNENGRFDIEIPIQYLDENIIISYVGYENEVYKISELENEYLLISMQDGPFAFEEVMIVNKEKPLKISNINNNTQLNGRQINSATSGVMGADIGRQIQLLPGISAHDDNSAAIKIRGSNSDETLMILDGMPIYNANHYYGVFSSVNTGYIDSVNIFKNTYPLQYGGKTAGVVELFSDDKQPTKTTANLNLDLLTTSGNIKIPITNNSQISIAGRSTYKAVNNRQFNTLTTPTQDDNQVQSFSQKVDDNMNDPDFTFYDFNIKYQYQNAKNDVFSINMYRSSDIVENDFKISTKDFNDNEVKLIAIDRTSWSNTAASILFSKSLNPRLRINTTAYFTKYFNEEFNDIKLDKKYKQGGPPPKDNPLMTSLGANQKNELMDASVDSHIDYDMNNHAFKIGINAINHDINYKFDDNDNNKLNGKENFFEIAGYAGHNIRFLDKFHLRSGLRATYFTNLKSTKFSPRFLLQYELSDQILLKSSFSIENQIIRQFYYEYRGEPMELWVSAGKNDIQILNSQNIMIGSTLKLSPFTIDIELYQKNMKGMLEFSLATPGESSNNPDQNRDYNLFKGNGRVKGIDIILSSGYKIYDTYLSYTLSRSEEQYKAIFNNSFFASENDRTHQFKWVNTLSFGDFSFGLNGIYVSGRPYTDISNVGPMGDIRDLDPKSRLKRVKAYHRADISGTYNFKIGRFNASLTASIFNLMNTNNVKYIQSIATQVNANEMVENTIIGNESELLNRTFNLGLRVGF